MCMTAIMSFMMETETFMIEELPSDEVGEPKNYSWEYIEQLIAYERLLPSDRVLMLGGNIGSACITADKLVGSSGGAVACVEPNPALHASLEFNREMNHAGFRLVKGVVGETPSEMATVSPGRSPFWAGWVMRS